MSLTRVWEPIKINTLEIKNRVVRCANTTTMFPDSVNDDFIAYHKARARGGVGLTILEAGAVHPNSQLAYAINDNAVRGFEKLQAACSPFGMKIMQQLWHGGHNLPGFGGTMPWSCSATPSALTGIVGVPMGQPEIDEVVAAFGTAAKRCQEAGLDGVEIHGGHGYLIQQFLSPLTNKREDGYNGDLLQRARFLVEVLQSVRKSVGKDFPVGLRMSTSSAKGGTSAEDIAIVAKHIESLGLIDFFDISYSDYFLISGMTHTMAFPSGYQLQLNEPITSAITKLPRIVTGRYRTLEEADQVLRDGYADMVSLVRAHIADPEIVKKTAEGRVEDVRPCIACNQGCVGGLLQFGRMMCAVNPAAGLEQHFDETLITKAEQPKKVMIIGGGPAGMEAARVASLRGHKVILCEAGAKLGGTLEIAKRAPHMHILGDLVDWLQRQVYKLGVDVRLNSYVEADDVLKEAPDALIVATGGVTVPDGRQMLCPGELPPGMDQSHVYDPAGVVLANLPSLKGKSALVFDDVGRYQAIAAAEHLAKAGAAVTFVTSHNSYAPKMYGTSRDNESMRRLNQGEAGFRLMVNSHLVEIGKDHCQVRGIGVTKAERIAADVTVVVTSQVPVRDLYDELREKIPAAVLAGDALSPRDLMAAMHDGHRAGRTI